MKYISVLFLLLSTYSAYSISQEVSELDLEIKPKQKMSSQSVLAREFTSLQLDASLLMYNWEGSAKVLWQYQLAKHFYFDVGYQRIAPVFGFGSDYKVNQVSGGLGFLMPFKAVESVDAVYYTGVDYLKVFAEDQNEYKTNVTGFNINMGLVMVSVANPNIVFTLDTDLAMYEFDLITSNFDFIMGYKFIDE